MGKTLHVNALGALLATLLLWAAVPPESPVADAAMQGDREEVSALLREGADVNAAQGDGMTALHWAAERGDTELTRVLLEAGANVAAATRLGDYTPLHLASRLARDEIVELLLDGGADSSPATSTGGALPLHFAAGAGSTRSIRALVEHGADVDARESSRGQTPLIFAASGGRLQAVRALVELGADVSLTSDVVDIREQSAEDQVAGQVRNEILAGFRGDQPPGTSWQPTPAQVQAAVRAGNAARDSAATQPPSEARERSFAREPDVDLGDAPSGSPVSDDSYDSSYQALVDGQGGLAALHHAVREGEVEITLALLDAGADIDRQTEGDGTSPILMAVINGHFDLALTLLDRGADPNPASHAGTTPLYATLNTNWAPKARYPQQQAYLQQQATHLDLMKALLDAGADPNARLSKHLWYMEYTFTQLDVDTRGATPFWRAAYALDLPAMRMLVAHGADPSIPTMKQPERRRGGRGGGDGGGDPPGADADPSGLPPVPEGGPGVYPIHAATGHAYGTGFAGVSHTHAPDAWLPVLQYLVEELGADVNARDANGFAPMHWAASRGDNEMIEYLVERGADVTVVSRGGHTTADMANGPVQRITPFPETIALLESLGSKNNHNCVSC
jgi:ankyrin repeat protein